MLHTRIPTTSTHAFSDGFFAVDTENLLNRAGARRGETPLHKHILRLTDSYVGFLSVEILGFSRNHRSPSCINANLNMRKISMSIDPTKKRQGKNIRVLLFVCLSRLWFLFIMWLISPFILLLPFLLFCIREHWFFFYLWLLLVCAAIHFGLGVDVDDAKLESLWFMNISWLLSSNHSMNCRHPMRNAKFLIDKQDNICVWNSYIIHTHTRHKPVCVVWILIDYAGRMSRVHFMCHALDKADIHVRWEFNNRFSHSLKLRCDVGDFLFCILTFDMKENSEWKICARSPQWCYTENIVFMGFDCVTNYIPPPLNISLDLKCRRRFCNWDYSIFCWSAGLIVQSPPFMPQVRVWRLSVVNEITRKDVTI